jgi:hypothetical protein
MKKLKYVFLLAASSMFFVACLKNQPQVVGAAGTAGATGAPGGDLPALAPIPFTLNSNTVVYGSGSLYYAEYIFTGYNPKYSYDLQVNVQRVSTPAALEWYTLPTFGIYQLGTPPSSEDELYASIGHDTIKIYYFSPATTSWPTDSVMQANIIVIPNSTPVK